MLHKQGGVERISFEAVYKDLDQLSDSTVVEYLQWAIENYVLKQATRVAIQKLPDYRFFIIRDEEGYRLVKRQDPRSYLSYDSSRIGSAFELMTDLRLVEINGAITLTATGRKVLQRLRAFHQSDAITGVRAEDRYDVTKIVPSPPSSLRRHSGVSPGVS
jgi:hypothetical protein